MAGMPDWLARMATMPRATRTGTAGRASVEHIFKGGSIALSADKRLHIRAKAKIC
jgi:hypothetical protein